MIKIKDSKNNHTQTTEPQHEIKEELERIAEPKKEKKKEHKEKEPCKECEELTDTLKRLQAEFENYKKRTDKEYSQMIKNANASVIKDMLPVLDSFELALKNIQNINPETEKLKKGVELIYAQLFSTLQSQGLRPIQTKDLRFDPYKHEVMLVKESSQEDDMILEEFQKGYMLNDNVIRHSKVMISKKKQEENDRSQDNKHD